MKGLITLLAFLILISGKLFSQAADYVFSSSTGTYSQITGTVSTATGDDNTQQLTIPFTFKYCGTDYTTAIVCTNGWLELGTTYLQAEHSNVLSSTIVKPIIAALWDDLYDQPDGDIQYTTQGSSPNQVFVVQWRKIRWIQSSGAPENFQIRLYETTNKIDIIYGTMSTPANGPSASIGMNDFTGGPGHFLSVTPGMPPTVSSTTSFDNITSITYLTSGLTYTFTPKLSVLPDSLGFGYTASGNSSAAQTYLLSGQNLTSGPIVVTAPAGFEVSLNGTAWSGSVNVTYTPPTLASTTIYARFSPTGLQADYSGNITNVGGGHSMNVEITGTSRQCAAGSTYCDEYIGQVQVGTIDNSSECSDGGYGDYTSLSTDMSKTLGYSITVSNGFPYEGDACGIWADWNKDGDLYDEGESITVSGGPEVFTTTITPPANAVEGNSCLRIRIHYPYGPTDPCGNGGDEENDGYGEVEDYTINVEPPPANPVFSVTPESKNYGECPLNNFSPDYFTQTFTVQNAGPGTLTISNVFLTGGDASQFVLTDPNSYPIGLSGASTIQFTVRFNPTTIGPKATTLRIQSSAKTDHDVALSGTGIVYPPQNLSGEVTPANTNELTWDPPLPEGEIRYDNGVASGWYWVSDPSTATDYIFTRFTAPANGNLDYVALFQSENPGSPDWEEIIVCPENGSTNTPDLTSPITTYASVPVNSPSGEWKMLQLTPSLALTTGTDFFLVAHWPSDSDSGPYVAGDASANSARSGFSSDGTTWSLWSGTYLMRAYMTTAKGSNYTLAAGVPNPSLSNLPVITITPVKEPEKVYTAKNAGIPVPGIYMEEAGRSLLSYSVLRGTSEASLADYITGITTTNYIDGSVSPLTTYYYGITALYSGSRQSDTSNVIFVTTLSCHAYTPAYTQNFDTVIAPAIPGCMMVTNDNSDAYSWNTSAAYSRSAPNSMFIRYNSILAMDDWFITPPLTLAVGIYNVSFWYRGSGTTSHEKLEVKWGNEPNAAGLTNGPIFDNNNITNSTYVEGTGSFTVSVAGFYYIGWHGYSDANMNFIVVDDINIERGPFTWTGNVNNEWNNAGNWDQGSVPDETIKVIIPSDPESDPDIFPVITTSVNCYKVNIATGSLITVQAPGVLNVINP